MAKKQPGDATASEKRDFERLRAVAETMFLQGATARDIADVLNVSEQTLSKWRKGKQGERSWDDRKSDFSLTPMRIKEILLKEAERIANGEEPVIYADALSKITAAIERLDKKISVQVVYDVLRELDNFTAEIDQKFAADATKFHKLFLQHRINIETGG